VKIYVGVFVVALGLVMLLSGGNGAAPKLWAVFFGKGLPNKTTPVFKDPGGNVVTPITGHPYNGPQLSPITPMTPSTPISNWPQLTPYAQPQSAVSNSFNGTNTLTGQGVLV